MLRQYISLDLGETEELQPVKASFLLPETRREFSPMVKRKEGEEEREEKEEERKVIDVMERHRKKELKGK